MSGPSTLLPPPGPLGGGFIFLLQNAVPSRILAGKRGSFLFDKFPLPLLPPPNLDIGRLFSVLLAKTYRIAYDVRERNPDEVRLGRFPIGAPISNRLQTRFLSRRPPDPGGGFLLGL